MQPSATWLTVVPVRPSSIRFITTPSLGTIGPVLRSVSVPESQTNLSWDVLLDLSGPDPGPRHERLARALRSAIRDGVLPVGTALPPSRKLAADLSCSRWLVTQAYAQLVTEGYLAARTGAATRVLWSPERDRRVAG